MKIFDVIVVGAGPSGISAGVYSKRLGLNACIIAKNIGGQINWTETIHSNVSVGNHIKSNTLIRNYKKALSSEDLNVIIGDVQSVDKTQKEVFTLRTDTVSYLCRSVIIATGRLPQRIPKVLFSEPFIKESLNNIIYFDDYPYRNLKGLNCVAIIGGGYCGLEAVEKLKQHVSHLYIVEKTNRLGGNEQRRRSASQTENINIYLEHVVRKIKYENEKYVIKLRSNEAIVVDGIFYSVGTVPVSNIVNCKKNKKGEIIIKKGKSTFYENMTSIKGCFACGDVTDRPVNGFEPRAIGEGIETAKAVYNYIYSNSTGGKK